MTTDRFEGTRVTERFPHITISIAHGKDDSDATGDLNSLSVGFGVFQAWIFLAVFGMSYVFAPSELLPNTPSLPDYCLPIVFDTFLLTLGACLLLLAFSNQLLLKFYVGKNALITATFLASMGTLLIYGTSLEAMGALFAVVAGVLMGIGASLMTVLWGTAFARYEFTTIILNTVVAVVIGVAAFLVLIHWVAVPLSGFFACCLPIVASLILWKLTPIPYYRRQEMPIFRPLPIHRTAFVLRFGLPMVIFGSVLGPLRHVCLSGLMPDDDLTAQLVIGAAACAGLAVIVATMAIAKNESYWDMIFRCVLPVIALSVFFVPQLFSGYALLAGFFVIAGYICFETLMWFLIADLSQEFRLSPIFTFGLGRGLLELGSLAGTWLAQIPGDSTLTGVFGNAEGALVLMLALAIAYSLLPRRREVLAIVDPNHVIKMPGYDALQTHIEKQQQESIEEKADDEPDESGVAEVDAKNRAKGRFHARCEEIADRYLLSRRETEVMFLLAKGHNAAFIQDKLCISKSTAKTHINHIYRKLDIHTQQELLNMVEDRNPDGEPAEDQVFEGGFASEQKRR